MLNAILPSAAVLTAAIIGALLWLRSRFEKHLDSYMGEKGKNLAREEDINKLAKEVRVLTKEAEIIKAQLLQQTETIKAQLSQENWDRQTRFLTKRDLYVRISEAIGELRNSYADMKGMERLRLQGAALRPDGALFDEKRREKLQAMEAAVVKLRHATDAAPLIVPDEPYRPLLEFTVRPIRFGTPSWEGDFEYNIAAAQWALYHFQVAARADLGFAPIVWKPIIVNPPQPD